MSLLLWQHVNNMAKLWKIECDPACGFLIRSHKTDEVYETAIRHCKAEHGKALTLAEARAAAVAA